MAVDASIKKMNLTDISQLDFNQLYTCEEYYSWKFPERIELIDGVPYQLMLGPRVIHQRLSMRFSGSWANFLDDKPCEVFAATIDVNFPNPKDGKTNTVVQPDIGNVCEASKIEEKGIYDAPDLIVEILFKDKKRDTHFKYNLYEREGVKEYWIVEPIEQWLIINTLNDNKKYIGSKQFAPEDGKINSVILPDFELDLKQLFDNEVPK